MEWVTCHENSKLGHWSWFSSLSSLFLLISQNILQCFLINPFPGLFPLPDKHTDTHSCKQASHHSYRFPSLIYGSDLSGENISKYMFTFSSVYFLAWQSDKLWYVLHLTWVPVVLDCIPSFWEFSTADGLNSCPRGLSAFSRSPPSYQHYWSPNYYLYVRYKYLHGPPCRCHMFSTRTLFSSVLQICSFHFPNLTASKLFIFLNLDGG